MAPRFQHPREWIAHVQNMLRKKDLDCVVVLTGEPGNGKSTVMYQIAKAFNPERFNLDRVHFTISEFIEDARNAEHYDVVAADEILIHRRHSAKKEVKDLIDFLQVCRGLNLVLLMCFPNAGMMDRAVLDQRVRYRIHVPEQGLAVLSERIKTEIADRSGQEIYAVRWVELCRWKFGPNTGPEWEEYHAKKITHSRLKDAFARGYTDPNDADDAEWEEILASRGLRTGSRKGSIKPINDDRRIPPVLRDIMERKKATKVMVGRHPDGCGTVIPCPTGKHNARIPEN